MPPMAAIIGSKAFFGAEGASSFLVTITKWLAITFACSSFYLSYVSSKTGDSLMAPEQSQSESAIPASKPESKTTPESKNKK